MKCFTDTLESIQKLFLGM